MRISQIPGFYEKLHEMEKAYITDTSAGFSLKHVDYNDKRMVHVRRLVNGKETKRQSKLLKYSEVDYEAIKREVDASTINQGKIASLLNMGSSTFSKKINKRAHFREDELGMLEAVLSLEKGKLNRGVSNG